MFAFARRWPILLLALLGALLAAACGEEAPAGAVHVLTADNEVGPVMEQYIDRGISRAEERHAKLVVIQLDTPGGLSTSMRDIIQRIERASVPIAVYVSPAGGRAASAGTFITMAANIAAMAPNTSIGAASAINSDGSDIPGTFGRKVENDAVSYIRGIAELRGRNPDWGEQAVRNAASVNQAEALRLNVVDFQADSLAGLLKHLDGTASQTGAGRPASLEGLVAAPIVHTDMTAWERILDFLADPSVASMLITLGFFGLVFELSSPKLVFPGVVGAIAVILGFIGFGTLPVHAGGLVLIALALAFFAIELTFPSGFLAAGGVVALILGAIVTFRDTPASVQPPQALTLTIGVAFIAVFGAVMTALIRAKYQSRGPSGGAAFVGKRATARTALTPEGVVFIKGERWLARLERGSADAGERVRVTGFEGIRLKVEKEPRK